MSVAFERIAKEWINHLSVTSQTKNTYDKLIYNQILPFWMGKRVNKQQKELNQYYEWLYLKKLSYHYIADVIIVFNNICKYAFEQGYIDKTYKLKYKSILKNRIDVLTTGEQNKILNHYLKEPNYLHVGVYLSLCLGLRIGEVCALMVSDIDFENRVLHVTKALQRMKNIDKTNKCKTSLVIKEPKTEHSVRDIPIPSMVYQILYNLYGNSTNIYLITGSVNFIDPRTYENIYKRLLVRLDIRIVKYHILRHTFATMSIQAGVNVKIVSEILGHASEHTTYNLYVHFNKEYKENEINKLDEYYKTQLVGFR